MPCTGRQGLAFLFAMLLTLTALTIGIKYAATNQWIPNLLQSRSPYVLSRKTRPLTGVEERSHCANKSAYDGNTTILKDRSTNYQNWKFDLNKAKRKIMDLKKIFEVANHLLIYKSVILTNTTSLAFSNHQRKDLPELTYHIQKQNSCAIVGNSGILYESLCGAEIDSHDFVVRMSNPPLAKFAKDAGNKVNVTYINRSRLIDLFKLMFGKLKSIDGSSRAEIMERMSYLNDSILWYGLALKIEPGNNSTKQSGIRFRLIIGKLREMGLPLKYAFSFSSIKSDGERAWKRRKNFTTGMNVLLYFLLMCNQVDVYGFFPFHLDSKCGSLKHHYYQTERIYVNYNKGQHDWKGEFSLLKELHNQGILRLITGKCTLKN